MIVNRLAKPQGAILMTARVAAATVMCAAFVVLAAAQRSDPDIARTAGTDSKAKQSHQTCSAEPNRP